MATTATKAKPRRRTQEERRATTRAALLDATIDCLVEYGYTGTTTTRVVERAGVSRGAQVHHFPTKQELVGAAVVHLTRRRSQEMFEALAKLPSGRKRTVAILDMLWNAHRGPLFHASMELLVAARTDPELRSQLVAVEREVAGQIREGTAAFSSEGDDSEAIVRNLDIVLTSMRGLALEATTAQGPKEIDARWRDMRERLLGLFDQASTTGSAPARRRRAA